MSQSIVTKCHNKKDMERMFEFLKKEFRPPSVLFHRLNKKHYKIHDEILEMDAIGDSSVFAGTGKNLIGFNYGPPSLVGTSHYYMQICRWIALQIGATRSDFKGLPPLPYTIYDGMNSAKKDGGAWPVITPLIKRVPKDFLWAQGDENGFFPEKSLFAETAKLHHNFTISLLLKTTGLYFDRHLKKNNALMSAEFTRLTLAWKKFNSK